ncbi:MAG: SET domain-containing protein [Verrucomicrobiales bacterium]|nr:SET domain-containing protein [Verrucomicrobiales bacterium]
MMLVPVRADRSAIHGLGLFASVFIPRGTPVWRFEPGFDRIFTPEEFARLPALAQGHLRHYGYLDIATRHWFLGGDLAIFMNHGHVPNTGTPNTGGSAPLTCALRDISEGDELTCDYRTFDASDKPIDVVTARRQDR